MGSSNYTRTNYLIALFAERYTRIGIPRCLYIPNQHSSDYASPGVVDEDSTRATLNNLSLSRVPIPIGAPFSSKEKPRNFAVVITN